MKKIFTILIIITGFTRFADANTNILFLTDIHFNPYGLCTTKPCPQLSQLIESDIKYWPQILAKDDAVDYKIETSNGFLTKGLNNLAPISKQASVKQVFLTGDILAHDFDGHFFEYAPKKYNNQQELTRFSLKVSQYVMSQIESATTNASIFYILGNNDGDHADYLVPSTEFLTNSAKTLSMQIPKSDDKQVFQSEFSQGGFYSIALTSKVTIIGVNTNLLSHIHPNVKLAETQLLWLNKALALAQTAHKQVIMLQHIPYGMDTYKSANIKLNIMLLDPMLQQKYLDLISKYSKNISGIYAGHFHSDYMLLLPNGKIPLISSIAFNTLFGNNPGFKILNLDDNGYLRDYTAYYTDIATNKQLNWQVEYRLSSAYQESNIISVIQNMPRNPQTKAALNYRKFYNGGSSGFLQPISTDSDWEYYYCAMQNVTANTYQACLDKN